MTNGIDEIYKENIQVSHLKTVYMSETIFVKCIKRLELLGAFIYAYPTKVGQQALDWLTHLPI